MTGLLRDRVLILDGVKALLLLIAGFMPLLTAETQTLILAALVAVFGLIEAVQTNEPVMVSVVELVQAVGVLAVGFGLNWAPEQVATLATFTGIVITLIERAQMSPKPVNA